MLNDNFMILYIQKSVVFNWDTHCLYMLYIIQYTIYMPEPERSFAVQCQYQLAKGCTGRKKYFFFLRFATMISYISDFLLLLEPQYFFLFEVEPKTSERILSGPQVGPVHVCMCACVCVCFLFVCVYVLYCGKFIYVLPQWGYIQIFS